ncbi:MAG TPA: hypothetical protein VIM77_13235, partial [Mucilaginibacter sp.]
MIRILKIVAFAVMLCAGAGVSLHAQQKKPFRVVAFYTGKNDKAHISFMHEAHKWFTNMGHKYSFTYDSTKNWNDMNAAFLARYQMVVFLDTRPDEPSQRAAFEQYM